MSTSDANRFSDSPMLHSPEQEIALSAVILTALAGELSVSPLVEITIRPARSKRITRAERCLRQLARPFFRVHHRLGRLYVTLALSPWWPVRAPTVRSRWRWERAWRSRRSGAGATS